MTVEKGSTRYGFINGKFGSLSPNPLPNGVLVTACYTDSYSGCFFKPSSIKSCTINNITFNDGTTNVDLKSYLKENVGKTIPVIFHFD